MTASGIVGVYSSNALDQQKRARSYLESVDKLAKRRTCRNCTRLCLQLGKSCLLSGVQATLRNTAQMKNSGKLSNRSAPSKRNGPCGVAKVPIGGCIIDAGRCGVMSDDFIPERLIYRKLLRRINARHENSTQSGRRQEIFNRIDGNIRFIVAHRPK